MNILPGSQFDIKAFREPPLEFQVTYAWVWNAPVTRAGIDQRLEEFLRAGVRSLYILPIPIDFRPENGRTFLDPDYLTDEFFDMVDYALHRCSELGILPWVYDEGGWPSGGACGHTFRENPKAAVKSLRKETVELEADHRFYPSGDGFIALFRGKKRLSDNYIASMNTTLTAYYVEERGNKSRVDYTSASATDTFIKNTYEPYKKRLGDLFPDALPIFFTDEPGLMRDSLAENEFEIFEKEYGYDLRDYIYVIEKDGALAVTDAEKRARIDHLYLLGKLSRENTFDRLRAWCESSGVYYGGHLDIDNRPYGGMTKGYFSLIYGLRGFHVPGIDVIWEQIRYPYGGRCPVDTESEGMKFFPKVAPSAARQEGRNVALTETFSLSGDGISPADMRYSANYQAIRGINAFNFMTAPYGRSRASALSGRPSFCPEKPGFLSMKQINEYYARLSYLARLGYAEGDTALYLPCYDFAASPSDLDDANAAFGRLGEELEERHIQFDIIDDIGIRDAEDTGDGLKLGAAIYRHIAVPACRYMPEDVRAKIAPYVGEGEAAYDFESEKLRVMTRRLDDGVLWFIFNEGEPRVREKLSLTGGRNSYRIDVALGEIYADSEQMLSLECGDIAVYYLTDRELEVDPENGTDAVSVNDLKAVSFKRFLIGYNGIYNEYGSGAPEIPEGYSGEYVTVGQYSIPADFSGEISFAGKYELKNEPRQGERYRVSLDGCGVFATVRLGEKEYPLGMSPMRITVSGDELKRCGEITVTLANTAANEVLAKYSLLKTLPKAELGTYSDKIIPFEEKRHPMKLGSVKIEKLI